MDHTIVDRRESQRRSGRGWWVAARLRPGRDVRLVDFSEAGALVETGARLLPGTRVILQLLTPDARCAVGARVLRCQVHAIDPDRGVRYRGALLFDQRLAVAAGPDRVAGSALPSPEEPFPARRGHLLPESVGSAG